MGLTALEGVGVGVTRRRDPASAPGRWGAGGAEVTLCPSAKAPPVQEEIWYKREGPINLV